MKNKLILFVVVVIIAAVILISYFAKRNFAVCRLVGGKLEIVSEECDCVGQQCLATTCSHENKCVWNK